MKNELNYYSNKSLSNFAKMHCPDRKDFLFKGQV